MSELNKAEELLNHIKDHIAESIVQYIDQPNDVLTRSMISSSLYSFLDNIEQRGGLEQFKIICDEYNNPPIAVRDNMLVCDIFIQPIQSLDYINIVVAVNSSTLELHSNIILKEQAYEAYERAMSILGNR